MDLIMKLLLPTRANPGSRFLLGFGLGLGLAAGATVAKLLARGQSRGVVTTTSRVRTVEWSDGDDLGSFDDDEAEVAAHPT